MGNGTGYAKAEGRLGVESLLRPFADIEVSDFHMSTSVLLASIAARLWYYDVLQDYFKSGRMLRLHLPNESKR